MIPQGLRYDSAAEAFEMIAAPITFVSPGYLHPCQGKAIWLPRPRTTEDW